MEDKGLNVTACLETDLVDLFQIKYRGETWIADKDSSDQMFALLDDLIGDNYRRKSKDDLEDISEIIEYMKSMTAEIAEDKLYLTAKNDSGDHIRRVFKELSIILTARKDSKCIINQRCFLIRDGSVVSSSENKEELLERIVQERMCTCGCCGKGVKVKRLKDAEKNLMIQPRALMSIPKQYEMDYLLEICPKCGYSHVDISVEPTSEEREAIERGIDEILTLNEAPATVKAFFEFATLAFCQRNYNLSLLLLQYAFDYHHRKLSKMNKLIDVRCAMINVSNEMIREAELNRLDIHRRTGQPLHKKYDDFDFNSDYGFKYKYGEETRRQKEAEYLLDLARLSDERKRQDVNFEQYCPGAVINEYEMECEALPERRVGSKTVIINSDDIDEPEKIQVDDLLILFYKEEVELVCKVRNIEKEYSLKSLIIKPGNTDEKKEDRLLYTLEILKEESLQ